LQKVLQMYAGLAIARAREKEEPSPALDRLLTTDAESWDAVLQQTEDLDNLLTTVQKSMETIVLSLDAGSMVQRVQAEYLQELVKRIEAAQQRRS
jgi:hypothetical protein